MEYYRRRWSYFFESTEDGCGPDSESYKQYQATVEQVIEQQFSNVTAYGPFRTSQIDDYRPVLRHVYNKYKDLNPLKKFSTENEV